MAAPITSAAGSPAVPFSSESFDAFNVLTWSPYIDQDDARMISYDLRCELESAFDVHPYSAKCRQRVVKSLLLWATMSRAQRHSVAWCSETNIQLGQNLVQHLLDLTAERHGIDTDAIYAALQADQHPYLKKMHQLMLTQGKAEGGELRGRSERVVSEPPRCTTYAVSPTPQRETSTRLPLRAPTVLAESLAREESHVAAGGAVAVAVPVPVPAPAPFAVAVDEAPSEVAPPVREVERAVAPKGEPPAPAPATPHPPAAVPPKTAKAPPPAFDVAVRESKTNGHAHGPQAPHATQSPASATTRESLMRKVVHPPPPPPPPPAAKASPAAPSDAKAAPRPPRPAAAAPPAPAARKDVAPPPQPVVHVKKQYTYSDSDDSSTSASAAAEEAPAEPPLAAGTPTHAANGATKSVADAVADEAELLRYGEDGTHSLLQECWQDVAADPDGVSAWFQRTLAVSAKDRALPLCVDVPEAISLDRVKARMEPRVAKRLDQLFQYLSADAPLELLPHREAAAFLSIADVDHLAAAHLIRPAKKSAGADTVIAFSVVDRAERKPSRRFFSWPCGSNRSAFQDGYEPHVPLHHISSYLDAVNTASGCTESLTSCFDQVELPPSLQERFVFTDAAHRRWCLTRLPMMHAIAAEVVQIILSTLCGHPSYALQNFATPSEVRSDVWVRTVRFYGTQAGVAHSRSRLRAACRDCGATLLAQAADTAGVYDFVGVHFDHGTHTVSVEPELLRRIAAPRRSISTRDLERHYTQLLFSASVLGVAASRFYKVLRTVCWRLSETQEEPDALLKEKELPLDAFTQLEKWHTSIVHNAPRHVKVESLPNMTLLLELSTEHWFSVLIGEESQETWNTGGSLEDVLGTKVACAAITKAVECFQPCIEKGAHVSIQILGGNVVGRNDKPIYRNEPKEVIEDCIRTHLVTRTFSFEVEYKGLNEGKGNGASAAHSKPAYKGKWA